MAIIRRPNTNYIAGTGITIAKADNAGLDAVDVTISAAAGGGLCVTWAGIAPTITGAGLVVRIPTVRGSSATFTLTAMFSRLEVLPSGTTSFRIEKSSGGGAFSPTTVQTTTHTTSDYEKTASASGTVASGDLLRIYFPTLATRGGAYEVQLVGT